MKQYLDVARDILKTGTKTNNRTGTDTYTKLGINMRFNLEEGFPVLTTRMFYKRKAFAEQLMFMTGKTSRLDLLRLQGDLIFDENGVVTGIKEGNYPLTFWDENMDAGRIRNPLRFNGNNLGNMYPIMWRRKPCSLGSHVLVDVIKVKPIMYSDSFIETLHEFDNSNMTHLKLLNVWEDYIKRDNRFPHNPWSKSLKLFLYQAYALPGFQEWVDSGYRGVLTSDYYGCNPYCAETSIFIPNNINTENRSSWPIEPNIINDKPVLVRPRLWIDQLQNVIDAINTNPDSRRMVIDSWNERDTENAVLGICHPLMQFHCINNVLSLEIYIRSNDYFLGAPANIANYALMLEIVAGITNKKVGELIYHGGNVHIYENHVDQINEMLKREPYQLPELSLPTIRSLSDLERFTSKDIKLQGYVAHEALSGKMAV